MQWVYNAMDPTGASVNEACVTFMANKFGVPKGNRSEGWRCMFGAAVAPFVAAPVGITRNPVLTMRRQERLNDYQDQSRPQWETTYLNGCDANRLSF